MKENLKRVNITIPESYHEQVKERGLNLSGLVREALEDQLSPDKITLSVSEKTHELYMQLFQHHGATDQEFESYLTEALKKYIDHLINRQTKELKKIKSKL